MSLASHASSLGVGVGCLYQDSKIFFKTVDPKIATVVMTCSMLGMQVFAVRLYSFLKSTAVPGSNDQEQFLFRFQLQRVIVDATSGLTSVALLRLGQHFRYQAPSIPTALVVYFVGRTAAKASFLVTELIMHKFA